MGEPSLFQDLVRWLDTVLVARGVSSSVLDMSLDVRYAGQSYEITVPATVPTPPFGLA